MKFQEALLPLSTRPSGVKSFLNVESDLVEKRFRPAAAPLLKLQTISKLYSNGTRALQDVQLTVNQGEFLSILGPSGCGKSTLLRLIAGLAAADNGTIEWRDGLPQEKHGIGFVFQEPTLLPWATVYDNVYLPLKLSGLKRRQAALRVVDALKTVGLSDFAKTLPRQLSGGMKMRVSIARALVVEPKILLLDEPFAALDEITRFRLNDDLLKLWQAKSLTVVFVTHSVFEAAYLSGRIVVMSQRPGCIIAEIENTQDHPRGEAYRTSSQYHDFCHRTSRELHRVVSGEDAPL
jgi:NitT/TauT family transport system ATP-binding protein